MAAKPVTAISKTAAQLSIAAAVTYQVLLVALLFIRPDLDPSWQTISVYAIGRHGWIMRLAFFISAVSYGALFVALKSQVHTIRGRIGLGVLVICVVGTVGAGVFVTDPLETPQNALSTVGTLHVITASSALILLPFAALLVNLSLARKNQAWSSARRVLLWTAGLPMLGLAGFGVSTAIEVPLDDHDVPHYGPGVNIGWPPRILFLIYMTWLMIAAWQVIKRRGRK
jgi:hypothetical protein